MAIKRKLIVVAAILLIAISLAAGILLARLEVGREEETNLFTYPLSVGDKTFIVTVAKNGFLITLVQTLYDYFS